MSEQLILKEFEHFLIFENGDDSFELEISELVKFDASEFIIDQDEEGYARDITFMNEESNLEFYKGFFEATENEYQLPNTLVVDKLGHAIEFIFEEIKSRGFETTIKYKLRQNNQDFVLGELDIETSTTDEKTYFKCKVVQSTDRALARRREDTVIDMFSDTDLDGNPISPLQTENVLLQAKPIIQKSKWISNNQGDVFIYNNEDLGQGSINYFNFMNQVVDFGIEDTLSFFDPPLIVSDLIYINAKTDLSNIKLSFKDVSFNISSLVNNPVPMALRLGYFIGEELLNPLIYATWVNQWMVGELLEVNDFNLNLNIGDIRNGEKLWIFFHHNQPVSLYRYKAISGETNIEVTSTAIDTVIKAVKYIDLAKQSLKSINGFNLTAPDFDNENGQFKDLYAFSGNLVRQRDDVPFYVNFKDRKENLMLFNADIQVNEQDAFALQYDKFYDNIDNGGFLLAPNENFERIFNPRYTANLLEWKFQNYEQDRDEENTLSSAHTEAQFSINNRRVKATKLIQIKDIYDPAKIESQRRQTVKTTTALDGDDKIHVMDMIPLSPSQRGGFTSSMTHQVDGNELKLLKDADLPSWSLLGFNLNITDFEITEGENQGIYTVTEIEDNIITLLGSPSGFNGISLTTVDYPLSNVFWTNRTNEDFDLIEGIDNPDKFGNLRYTIRRNLVHWESYISTCAEYIDDDLKNTYFKNNGELRTQYQGGEIYKENADIVLDNIRQAILTPKMYDIELIVSYDEILELIRKYQEIETVGGYIRVQDTNGVMKKVYPQKLGYTWATKRLSVLVEERKQNENIVITKEGNNIIINDVSYTLQELPSAFYESEGEYVALLDNNNIKIVNFTKYDKFEVQGGTFDNATDLIQALINL